MQRHERRALEAVTEAAQALDLEVHVLPRGRNPHLQIDVVDPATRRKERITVSCSPRSRDSTEAYARQAATRACRRLLKAR